MSTGAVQGQNNKIEAEKILKEKITPKVVNGIAYIPVRKFYESLGWQVLWDQQKSAVTVKNDNRQVEFRKGSSTAIIDKGYEVRLESPLAILEDRAYICSTFITQEFGLKIKWDKEKNILLVPENESRRVEINGSGNVIILSDSLILNIYEAYGMDTVRDMLQHADSLLSGGNPGEALQKYREVLDNISREQCPDTYAYVLCGMGNALSALAGLSESRAGMDDAIDLYFRAAGIFNESGNYEYRRIYNNIGLCYSRLYELTGQKEYLELAKDMFGAAIEGMGAAKDEFAAATVEENLGKTCNALGDKEAAEEHLSIALKAYKSRLEAYTAAENPEPWSELMLRLGEVYMELSFLYDGENNLLLSREYFEKALKVRNIESCPLDYAKIQQTLGDIYSYLFEIHQVSDYLHSAIEAYKESLRIYSAEKYTVRAAAVNNKLGRLYLRLGAIE